jgi:adenosylhomocysteine nucleosidase
MEPVAILSSMDQEISAVEARIADPTAHEFLGQRFLTGTINGVAIVATTTGYGKVGAAATTASVLHRFQPAAVVFGGVAGGIDPEVRIGDVVIGDRFIQHDYDASPIFAPQVIPSLGVSEIPADPRLSGVLGTATARYLRTRASSEIVEVPGHLFEVASMTQHTGLIGSGDQFISGVKDAADLHRRFPRMLAVEMEGAAVAQVCAERDTPFAVFRLISDRADQDAEFDFISFVSSVAAPLAAGIIDEFLTDLG